VTVLFWGSQDPLEAESGPMSKGMSSGPVSKGMLSEASATNVASYFSLSHFTRFPIGI
jgi:hypothetical protein